MLRSLLVTACAICVLTTTEAADTKKVDDETKAMNGTWELVSAELGGMKLPDEVVKSLTLVMKDGKYTLKSPGPDDTGTVKIDPTKKPKELDVTGLEGPNKGKSFPAIYELDGDSLKVCYDLDGKKRPTEFKSTADTKQFFATYKRKKG
ncbi:Uncharacterized protein OS=Pedosphaera parvula (strain Ellin514) GN=Cflav_PD2062 PE=4 SV=1 [Gemmata massiliana]|uniref:TIGR03067 domain-containing protein n=1 Tax=Gemmata massiliana TaxID=1210884 RepID=A0A6P2DFH5_9BACT|nr:TIGR03067 domain-containing protein [Gemmata massiliana]VTR98404.1 Uncharacterized protein OS=Pedosphaera parvula (strain Ellin514) GN=Cflav_PD2062 PE=4 SV=1 [Gemmata massiliana]